MWHAGRRRIAYSSIMKVIILFSLFCWFVAPFVSATTFYITRHYEKTAGEEDPSLTPAGEYRAYQLAARLKDKNIQAIYSTRYARTVETASPLAQALGLEIIYYDPDQLKKLVKDLKRNAQTALVVGHSNTTPQLIELLGGPAFSIAENDYGKLFTLNDETGKAVITLSEISVSPPTS